MIKERQVLRRYEAPVSGGFPPNILWSRLGSCGERAELSCDAGGDLELGRRGRDMEVSGLDRFAYVCVRACAYR